jgi:hypothetical protein
LEKAKKISQMVIREKISYFGQLKEMAQNGDFVYYFEKPEVEKEKLIFKDGSVEEAEKFVGEFLEKVSILDDEE